MTQGTDVFIIGGGPAGLAAAIAARQKGLRVAVADGMRPPMEKACGEGLMPDAVAALRELGIALEGRDGFEFRGVRFVEGGEAVDARFPAEPGIGVRRPALHEKMVERAQDLGVSFLWRTPVTGLCAEGAIAGGRTISARWIVGADGIRSRVRSWAELDSPLHREMRHAFRLHFDIEPWSGYMELYWGRDAQAYVTPVGRRQVCVVLISSTPDARRFEMLREEFPALAERLGEAASGAERGAITVARRLKRVYRGNVALVGDASGSVDAVTGEGLSLSFRQAGALADALAAGDLRRYQRAHRRLTLPAALMGRLLLLLARHERLRARTMQVLASDSRVFARLLAVHVGATSPAHLATTSALFGWRWLRRSWLDPITRLTLERGHPS